jgi:DsbC/DsbD-like thiol-disulfide interchange protein
MPLLLLILAFATSLPAQRPTDIVKWSAEPASKSVRAGAVVKIRLKADIEDGWKLYALTQPKGGPIALAIEVPEDAPFTLVPKDIVAPRPSVQKDPLFSADTQYYEDEASFTLPVGIPKTASGGQTVPIDVTFQACGKDICLRPFTQRLDVTISVTK